MGNILILHLNGAYYCRGIILMKHPLVGCSYIRWRTRRRLLRCYEFLTRADEHGWLWWLAGWWT